MPPSSPPIAAAGLRLRARLGLRRRGREAGRKLVVLAGATERAADDEAHRLRGRQRLRGPLHRVDQGVRLLEVLPRGAVAALGRRVELPAGRADVALIHGAGGVRRVHGPRVRVERGRFHRLARAEPAGALRGLHAEPRLLHLEDAHARARRQRGDALAERGGLVAEARGRRLVHGARLADARVERTGVGHGQRGEQQEAREQAEGRQATHGGSLPGFHEGSATIAGTAGNRLCRPGCGPAGPPARPRRRRPARSRQPGQDATRRTDPDPASQGAGSRRTGTDTVCGHGGFDARVGKPNQGHLCPLRRRRFRRREAQWLHGVAGPLHPHVEAVVSQQPHGRGDRVPKLRTTEPVGRA